MWLYIKEDVLYVGKRDVSTVINHTQSASNLGRSLLCKPESLIVDLWGCQKSRMPEKVTCWSCPSFQFFPFLPVYHHHIEYFFRRSKFLGNESCISKFISLEKPTDLRPSLPFRTMFNYVQERTKSSFCLHKFAG